MVLNVSIEKSSNHSLILRIVFLCLGLEELNTTLTQSQRHFDSIIPEDQILRRRKKVGNNLKLSERFICVFDFRAHRFAFLFANNRLRKYE